MMPTTLPVPFNHLVRAVRRALVDRQGGLLQRRWPLLVVCLIAFQGLSANAQQAGQTTNDQSLSSAESESPAKDVYVAVSQAQLHSGPADDYYPTTVVEQGKRLSVFHRTDDGWLAIRPPSGSFSWVPATDAFLLPGGKTIEVTNDDAVSWIGTQLGSAKQYRWQVQLRRGEQLTVLGEAKMQSKDGREALWYRVAPPSGEFRWIHEQTVTSQPVLRTASAGGKSGLVQTASATGKPVGVTTAAYQVGELIPPGEAVPENARPSQGGPTPIPMQQSNSSGALVPSLNEAPIQLLEDGTVVPMGQYPAEGIVDGQVFYDGMYMDGQIIEGDYIDGQIVEGPYYDGEYIDGEYYDDGYVVDGGHVGQAIPGPASSDPFDGWHAVSVTDDGMRFHWLERLFWRRGVPKHDPKDYDPFSLEMSKPLSEPVVASTVYSPMVSSQPVVQHHSPRPPVGDRPWRDPRKLGRSRGRNGSTGGERVSSANSKDSFNQDEFDRGEAFQDRFADRSSGASDSSDGSGVGGALGQAADRVAALRGALEQAMAGGETLAQSPNSEITAREAELERLSKELRDEFRSAANDIPSRLASQTITRAAEAQLGAVGDLSQVDWYGIGQRTGDLTQLAQASGLANASLNRLQLSLSEMVSQPMAMWHLAPLADETQRLIRDGATALERGQARLLMERLQGFADVAQRSGYPGLPSNLAAGSSAKTPVQTASFQTTDSQIASLPQPQTLDKTAYDATGWLVPVHAAAPGQPSHALTDDNGKIVAYVSTLPGVRLDHYINEAVGIRGLKGYLPALQAGHIQANQVMRLR